MNNSVNGRPLLYVVPGIQASGKTTVGRMLADTLDPSVFVEGDVVRRMVRNGRAEMTPAPSDAALAQLRLRYRHIAVLAESYLAAGFNTVVEDVVLGDQLLSFVDLFTFRPLHLVVLAPDADTVARREAAREKSAYGADRWLVGQLDQVLREQTPRHVKTVRPGPKCSHRVYPPDMMNRVRFGLPNGKTDA